MTDITPNLALPYLMAAQAQKHVTHNEAIRSLDALVQLSVLDRHLMAPPGSPADGARYIVAAGATGAWAGGDGRVAAWQDGAWELYVPRPGWLVWIADESLLAVWTGSAWVAAHAGPNPTPLVGVNATADTTNRLAVAAPASLFSHEGAGHQVKVNKAAAAQTGALLFQTDFSGRAELGLAGDDDFRLKVSADGALWRDAIRAHRATGRLELPNGFQAPYNVLNALGMLHKFNGVPADTAVSIDLAEPQFGSFVFLYTNGAAAARAIVWCRAATTPLINSLVVVNSLGLHIGPLTGTTGTAGRINMSCDTNGRYWFENRLTGPANLYIGLLRSYG